MFLNTDSDEADVTSLDTCAAATEKMSRMFSQGKAGVCRGEMSGRYYFASARGAEYCDERVCL